MRRLISSGSTFERDIGYSRAVVADGWVFVSGTTGFDYATMTIADDVATQAERCLDNIEAALAEAGCTLGDVVRVRYILPRAEDFPACRMRIEIEVTARVPRDPRPPGAAAA
jgi:enamine deaminase RidA (YjgF/YER057c/UK114 family)